MKTRVLRRADLLNAGDWIMHAGQKWAVMEREVMHSQVVLSLMNKRTSVLLCSDPGAMLELV
jgi:hypothetical protein